MTRCKSCGCVTCGADVCHTRFMKGPLPMNECADCGYPVFGPERKCSACIIGDVVAVDEGWSSEPEPYTRPNNWACGEYRKGNEVLINAIGTSEVIHRNEQGVWQTIGNTAYRGSEWSKQ